MTIEDRATTIVVESGAAPPVDWAIGQLEAALASHGLAARRGLLLGFAS